MTTEANEPQGIHKTEKEIKLKNKIKKIKRTGIWEEIDFPTKWISSAKRLLHLAAKKFAFTQIQIT